MVLKLTSLPWLIGWWKWWSEEGDLQCNVGSEPWWMGTPALIIFLKCSVSCHEIFCLSKKICAQMRQGIELQIARSPWDMHCHVKMWASLEMWWFWTMKKIIIYWKCLQTESEDFIFSRFWGCDNVPSRCNEFHTCLFTPSCCFPTVCSVFWEISFLWWQEFGWGHDAG
jgi:hypothetical protein